MSNTDLAVFPSDGCYFPTCGYDYRAIGEVYDVSLALLSRVVRSTSAETWVIKTIGNKSDYPSHYPTNPISYADSLELHSQLANALIGFDSKNVSFDRINEYLNLDDRTLVFLQWLPMGVKEIFGADTKVALNSLDEYEPGDPLLEAKILTELLFDEVFDEKEKLLFKSIDDLSMASALGNIVITYG